MEQNLFNSKHIVQKEFEQAIQNKLNEKKFPFINLNSNPVIFNKKKYSMTLYDKELNYHNGIYFKQNFYGFQKEFINDIKIISTISPLPNYQTYSNKNSIKIINNSWYNWYSINNILTLILYFYGYCTYQESGGHLVYFLSHGKLELIISNERFWHELENNKK